MQRKVQDVYRGVDIAIQFKGTFRTQMHPNTQGLFDKLTTTAASLRRVGGIHKRDEATSFYRFVAEQRLERTESSIVGRQGQVKIARHKSQIERFEGNQVIVMHQPVRQPMPEIAPLVGDDQALILAVMTPFFRPTEFALRPPQFRPACRSQRGLSISVPSESVSRRSNPISPPTEGNPLHSGSGS